MDKGKLLLLKKKIKETCNSNNDNDINNNNDNINQLSRPNTLRKEIDSKKSLETDISRMNIKDIRYQETVKQLKQQDGGILVVPLTEVKINNEPPSRHISKLKKPAVFSRLQTHGPDLSIDNTDETKHSTNNTNTIVRHNNYNSNNNNNNNNMKDNKILVFNSKNERTDNNNNNNNNSIIESTNEEKNNDSLFTTYHHHHLYDTYSDRYLIPPKDSTGNRYDLSDRPIMCSSSNKNNEVVFGSSDHSLYSIDINNPSKRPIQMYNKRQGHTDWVTSVAHLADGRVLSSGMDGKICLWDQSRRNATELIGHGLSISKIVTDQINNIAISCGYDKNVSIWSLRDNGKSRVSGTNRTSIVRSGVSKSSSSSSSSSTISTSTVLRGHADAVVECAFYGNTLASGSRDGGLILWDTNTSSSTHKIRAHQGTITCIESFAESSIPLFLTTGEDGYVKLWDPRGSSATDSLINKIPAHIKNDKKNPSMLKGASISCIGKLSTRGVGLSYIVTCGADNSLVLMDARKSFEIIEKWEHAKNCIYSLCVVGDRSIFIGDGAGMLLCYDVLSSNNNSLKYGLGASEIGGVRTINCSNNGKIITGSEDGKALCFSF